jgi:Uma2 family endonuclease
MTLGGATVATVRRAHLYFDRRAEQTTVMVTGTDGWTVDEVRELQDESRAWPRFELIAGELLVTPSPGTGHQVAVAEFLLLLATYVDRENIGVALASPADLELHPGTVAQPDVFVVPRSMPAGSGKGHGWKAVASLLVAVEVVSPDSVRRDRVVKRDYYLTAGVPEYWVVDLDARAVERWSAGNHEPVSTATTLEWKPSGARKALVVDLPALFERITRKRDLVEGA